ncbi:hypothetical protein DXG01_010710 [Tephrocybe rancida]|nr:hypothetical protein DXG01_010710 [Tephrocybe rancida]
MVFTTPIPRELINTIIDELVDDPPALFACSLTSSLFRKIAQKHIFREIAISFDTRGEHSSNAELLSQILPNNAALSSLAESLILRLGDPQAALQNVELLGVFPSIRKLTLTSRSDYTDWRAIPDELRGTLTMLLNRPSLTFLALHRQSHFPVDILLGFPNIVGLSMEATSTERLVSPSDQASSALTSTPHLQTFLAVVYGDDGISLGAVQDTLKVCASSLTDVTLDCLGYEDGLPPRLQLIWIEYFPSAAL